ncbi:GNAT family N-acetyltransferase [Lentilactobacillus kisonensis]|uniref:Acetyltransferase, GNAT family n=1 Tax=Lentilactobacillus kisonensis F0435 TaxID=797516 RepID=H1LDZ1_9LACO|nr:GNAT family N-acetyltransferase [Lentilactobacillus kisonensis]EHO52866.1 acetyltransferase, GNAT family [Lentilactobacillus kisonensis F0435]
MATIRPIKSKDDASLARIIKHLLKSFGLNIPGTAYFDPELNQLSAYYAESDKRQYFVAINDQGNVLGGVGIAEYDTEAGVAELQKLYLDQKAQGQHLSYKLLDTAVEFAKQAGYQKLYLETYHSLTTAIHLYQRYGFTDLGHPLNVAQHSTMDRFFIMNL